MAAARLYRPAQPSRFTVLAAMVAWSALSFLPDADVLGFRFGIRYGDPLGHRGATHSIAFALLGGAALAALAPLTRLPALLTGFLAAGVLLSHPLLDTLTDGGLGCALLWPFDTTRYFAPWNPIPVAPIGRAFFTPEGLRVAAVELALFAPLFIYALWPRRHV